MDRQAESSGFWPEGLTGVTHSLESKADQQARATQTGASWQQSQLNYLTGEDAEVYMRKAAKVNVPRPEKGAHVPKSLFSYSSLNIWPNGIDR